MSGADNSSCSGCHIPFNFIRKRHNCYNCGLVFCKACSSRKSLKASLAPSTNKPYRVCDDCFTKLQKAADNAAVLRNVKIGGSPYKPSESTEKETGVPRLPGNTSRLSSAESFKSDRSSAVNVKCESNDNRVFPLQNGNIQRPSISSKSPTSPFGAAQNFLSFFLPDSRLFSRSPSPVLGKSSLRSTTPSPSSSLTLRTSEGTPDDMRIGGNDSLSLEVRSLKAQVEKLTSKTQVLEAKLARKSKQLKEMNARAADEAEKSKAAKEVIKSLTAQLKEMAERVPGEQLACSNLDANEQMASEISRPSNGAAWQVQPLLRVILVKIQLLCRYLMELSSGLFYILPFIVRSRQCSSKTSGRLRNFQIPMNTVSSSFYNRHDAVFAASNFYTMVHK
ncbi:UNVERIFIED_CONTAM: PH, RCC1 and FYVE domains-containing protein 1 [Sesamum radiatum]|uniref:PH, RCC1 and FYVE domains-containing protein 1 n=1 Tax=Sesamum radiatum TaxID=300843 RepID=A0AAW2MXV9_SESRA